MTKDELYTLLEEMAPAPGLVNSAGNPGWFAHRKAEKLRDQALLPLLRAMIEERSGKKDKEIRRSAYFVLGKLLQKEADPEYCRFFVDCLTRETDKYVLGAMLTDISWLQLPGDVGIGPIAACSRSDKWLVRHNAINALRASDTEASREALRYWVGQTDEKAYKYELIYAQASLGYIGTAADIPLLEAHTRSRIRDVRDSAAYAIENIRQRLNV